MSFFPSNFASSTLALASDIFQGFLPFVNLMVGIGVVLLLIAFILRILT
jgi:hypothetical protein